MFIRRKQLSDEAEARDDASLRIKVFLLRKMRAFKSKLSGEAFKMYANSQLSSSINLLKYFLLSFYRHKWAAITKVQKLYRGFKGREAVYKKKIHLAASHYAATIIQRYFRFILYINLYIYFVGLVLILYINLLSKEGRAYFIGEICD